MGGRGTIWLGAISATATEVIREVAVLTAAGIGTGIAGAFLVCVVLWARGGKPDIATISAWAGGFGAVCGLGVAIIDCVIY
jgi:hypothetical protein